MPEWEERYQAKVGVAGPDECWPWLASQRHKGYGQLWADGRIQAAHRLAWMLENGEIPDGQCVCHECDNPSCVNPAHLFLGTNADNLHDMWEKGRGVPPHVVGTANGRSKLDEKEAQEIRKLYATGEWTQRQLAKRYSVSKSQIGRIVRWEHWTHAEQEAT